MLSSMLIFTHVIHVKHKIDVSTIPNSGKGLFADEDVLTGTRVFDEFSLKAKWPKDLYEHLPQPLKDSLLGWGYLIGEFWYLDTDAEMYVQHSRNPNTVLGIAVCDIKKGEEFFIDYRTYEDVVEDNPDWL